MNTNLNGRKVGFGIGTAMACAAALAAGGKASEARAASATALYTCNLCTPLPPFSSTSGRMHYCMT